MNKIEVHTEQSIEDPNGGFLFLSDYYPSRIFPETDWFNTESGVPIEDCLTEFAPGDSHTGFYKEIIDGAWESTVDNPAFYHSLQSTIFKLIDDDPGAYTKEAELMNFYQSQQNTIIRQRVAIRHKAKACYQLSVNEMATLASLRDQWEALRNDIRAIDKVLESSTTPTDMAQLKTEKIQALQAGQQIALDWQEEVERLEAGKMERAAEGLALVEAFPAQAPYEHYFKAVYHIYFQRMLQGGILTDHQIAELTEIGSACPMDFGNIIDMARGLIPSCRRPYFDDRGCIPIPEEHEEYLAETPPAPRRNAPSSSLRVFPNPNEGAFRMENIPLHSNVKLVDIHGKIIRQVSSNKNSTLLMDDLSPGIYILSIQSPKRPASTHKIMVTH